jgi:hypothetical protein
MHLTRKCKQAIPIQAWTGHFGSRKLRLPEFLDNRHMKAARLALRTGRLYPARRYPWHSFLLVAEPPPGHSQLKIPMTPSVIVRPAAAQDRNQLRHRVLHLASYKHKLCIWHVGLIFIVPTCRLRGLSNMH